MSSTRIARHIDAPRHEVYRLLLDADAVAEWLMPDGRSGMVHRFEPEEGGGFSITLVDDGETGTAETELPHDAYYGRFVTIVPDERVVEVLEFVTTQPDLLGEMTIDFALTDAADGGTDLLIVHENQPPGLTQEDNEIGWRNVLDKFTAIAERRTAD